LGDFWKKEIARLNKEKPMITKISMVNGKTDTIRTNNIDWEKELQIFVKNDISKSDLQFYKSILVDSLDIHCGPKPTGSHITRRWESHDSLSNIQSIVFDIACGFMTPMVDEKGNELEEPKFYTKDTTVIIELNSNQQLYQTHKSLVYNTERGFVIRGSQDVKFVDEIDYQLEVRFHSKVLSCEGMYDKENRK